MTISLLTHDKLESIPCFIGLPCFSSNNFSPGPLETRIWPCTYDTIEALLHDLKTSTAKELVGAVVPSQKSLLVGSHTCHDLCAIGQCEHTLKFEEILKDARSTKKRILSMKQESTDGSKEDIILGQQLLPLKGYLCDCGLARRGAQGTILGSTPSHVGC